MRPPRAWPPRVPADSLFFDGYLFAVHDEDGTTAWDVATGERVCADATLRLSRLTGWPDRWHRPAAAYHPAAMSLSLSPITCPNCGAPHSLAADRRVVVCIYCNTSLLVGTTTSTANNSAPVTAQPVSKEDIERVKQLLIDGRRKEAVSLYASLASVTPAEAEEALGAVVVSSYFALTRAVPLNAIGFVAYGVFIAAGLGLAGWSALRGSSESPAWFVATAAGVVFAVTRAVNCARHLRSTLVHSFGALGRGRVMRRAVLRETKAPPSCLVAVMFEVTPDDGSAPFVDQENLLVKTESLQKLSPGNVVRVRFDAARAHVFPVSPMEVIGRA